MAGMLLVIYVVSSSRLGGKLGLVWLSGWVLWCDLNPFFGEFVKIINLAQQSCRVHELSGVVIGIVIWYFFMFSTLVESFGLSVGFIVTMLEGSGIQNLYLYLIF